jgi:hypothetical protein
MASASVWETRKVSVFVSLDSMLYGLEQNRRVAVGPGTYVPGDRTRRNREGGLRLRGAQRT